MGFRGAPYAGNIWNPHCEATDCIPHDVSNLAMTYTALATLAILGDDFSRVKKDAILAALPYHVRPDGSVLSTCLSGKEGEADVRFSYCLCAVCYMLDDWHTVDREKIAEFLLSTLSIGGGFAQYSENEGHAGSTFCVVASLYLMVGPKRLAVTQCCTCREYWILPL